MRTIFAVVLALVSSVTSARAGTDSSCDHDPKCVGRELALVLTGAPAQHALVIERVVDFEPGRLRVYSKTREKIQAIAETWQRRAEWSVITVRGYADAPELAKQRADKIRGYFIRYGVPAEFVVAVGQHAVSENVPGTVGLSIALCDGATGCGRLAQR